MNIVKYLIVIATVASISACSKGPSESDAKQVVLNMLGDCSHLSLERFEKTNGIAIGERGYKVDITYSVKVMALPESKKMVEEILAQLAEIDVRLEKAKAARTRVYDEDKAIDAKMDKAQKDGNHALANALYDESRKVSSEINLAIDLVNSIEKERGGVLKGVVEPLSNKFAKECPNVNAFLYANLYQDADAAQYAKDFTKEFSGTIPMIKTDNGWKAAQ